MQNAVDNYPPIQYSSVWLFVGIALVCLVVLWFGFVLWLTRRKKIRNVTNLRPVVPVVPDLAALQAKYLALVLEVEQSAARNEIDVRGVHQKMSILLRFFAYEAKGIKAHVLTLADLKQTRLTSIANAIEGYYTPEFNQLKRGDSAAAIAKAREVVTTWS